MWTKSQEKAIFEKGKNIIVSAGAGSGKTAVLSERILEFCKNGVDIRNVLVLTFTNKAASEMKERIRKKLYKNNLSKMASLVDCAYITTFDSFSLGLVKKYYYLLDLGKDFNVMDQTYEKVMLSRIIDDIFDERYLKNDEAFKEFIYNHIIKDDKPIKNDVKSLCEDLSLITNLDDFYNNYEKNFYNENKYKEIKNDFIKIIKDQLEEYYEAVDDLLSIISTNPKNAKVYDAYLEQKNGLMSSTNYSTIRSLLTIKMPKLAPKSGVEEEKKKVSEILKKIVSSLKYNTLDDMIKDVIDGKNDVLYLLNLSYEVIKRLDNYKKLVNQYSFSDIARFAIKLVKDNNDIRNYLKNQFYEILVDEYQDTSDVQETFLSLIDNNNRYMVGDIKQSIYRFRNANPYIFKDKYDNYSKNNGGIKIDLTHNFRSRCEVVNNINSLFNDLMTNELGDANYKLEHQMKYGQIKYEDIKQSYDFNVEYLEYEDSEDYKSFTTAEKQAFIAVKKIKEIIDSKVMVLKEDKFREVQYSDFAILIAKGSEFATFKKVFEFFNIPSTIEADLDLKDSKLVPLFYNVINLISKTASYKSYNHSLAALARSFCYNYTDEDIYRLVVLKEKFPILDDIIDISKVKDVSYESLFFAICNKFKIYEKINMIGDTISSLVVLENIFKMFNMFQSLSMNISEARDYLNIIISSDNKYSYKSGKTTNNEVKIMTIHASKGLEFPFCIFPMNSDKFNEADSKKNTGYNRKYGIFMPRNDEGFSNTVIKDLNSKMEHDENLSERIRLYYVALTRAREKIIIIDKYIDNDILYKSKINSFSTMLKYAKSYDIYVKNVLLSDYNITSDYKKVQSLSKMENKGIVLEYNNDLPLQETVEKGKISKTFATLQSKQIKDSINLGLEFHAALEAVSFKNKDVNSLNCSSFIKNKIIELMKNPIFDNIDKSREYHEYEFYFDNNNETYHGVIDLLLVYNDHVDIIDYKLSDTNSEEYKRQLNVYKLYVEKTLNLKANIYLLSILKNEINKL